MEKKFDLIDAHFGSFELVITSLLHFQLNLHLVNGLLMPGIIAALYLYVYPKVAEPVYKDWLKNQKVIRETKQSANEERLYSVEESRKIYRDIAQAKALSDEKEDSLQKQILALNKSNKSFIGENSKLNEKIKELISRKGISNVDTLTTEEIKSLLQLLTEKYEESNQNDMKSSGKTEDIDEARKGLSGKELIRSMSLDELSPLNYPYAIALEEFQYVGKGRALGALGLKERCNMPMKEANQAIDFLVRHSYLHHAFDHKSVPQYQLTSKGSRYLLERDLIDNQL